MANLEEIPSWESVYQIERTDPVLGGVDGVANKPLKNLVNRTAYLKEQVESITTMLDLLFPIGHMLITRNPNNPNSYGYPGEWRREADDFSLISTTNNSQLGQVAGDNNPPVPLPSHSHTASSSSFNYGTKRSTTSGSHSHTATFKGNSLPPHAHSYQKYPKSNHFSGTGRPVSVNERIDHNQAEYNYTTSSVSSGTPTGSVSLISNGNHYHDISIGAHSHSVTVNGTGVSGANLDVRGKCMKVAVWTRIS